MQPCLLPSSVSWHILASHMIHTTQDQGHSCVENIISLITNQIEILLACHRSKYQSKIYAEATHNTSQAGVHLAHMKPEPNDPLTPPHPLPPPHPSPHLSSPHIPTPPPHSTPPTPTQLGVKYASLTTASTTTPPTPHPLTHPPTPPPPPPPPTHTHTPTPSHTSIPQ